MLDIYRVVTARGQPNFRGARIPLTSNFDFHEWSAIAHTQADQEVLQYLKYSTASASVENSLSSTSVSIVVDFMIRAGLYCSFSTRDVLLTGHCTNILQFVGRVWYSCQLSIKSKSTTSFWLGTCYKSGILYTQSLEPPLVHQSPWWAETAQQEYTWNKNRHFVHFHIEEHLENVFNAHFCFVSPFMWYISV